MAGSELEGLSLIVEDELLVAMDVADAFIGAPRNPHQNHESFWIASVSNGRTGTPIPIIWFIAFQRAENNSRNSQNSHGGILRPHSTQTSSPNKQSPGLGPGLVLLGEGPSSPLHHAATSWHRCVCVLLLREFCHHRLGSD